MRALLCIVLLAAASPARADSRADVEKTVRFALDCKRDCSEHFLQLQTAYTVLPSGQPIDAESARTELFDMSIHFTTKLGAIVIDVDDKHNLAWFAAPLDATVDGKPRALRVVGIVHKEENNWHVAALAFSRVIADRDLLALGEKAAVALPKTAPKITGDDTHTGEMVAAWFKSGFAAHASSGAKVIATGTAPAESANGAAAVAKLAKSWDALGLVATKIDTHAIDTYMVFVQADVLMPLKKKPGFAAPLSLAIVVITDGTFWEWAALSYSPAFK